MEQFSTEEQQAEALRKWLKENGPSILIGIALGLGLMFGINRWQAYKIESAETVSLKYAALQNSAADGNPTTVATQAERLREQHPDSGYAVFAAFAAADAALAADPADFAAAERELRWVADHAPIDGLKQIGRLRLARLLLSSGDSTAAEALLTETQAAAFKGLYAEVKGDIAVVGGNPDAARAAYSKALAVQPDAAMLRRKLENLGGAPES